MVIHGTAAAPAESEIPRTDSVSSMEKDPKADLRDDKEKIDVESLAAGDEDVDDKVIRKDEEVAVEVSSTSPVYNNTRMRSPSSHRSSLQRTIQGYRC